MLMPCGSGGAAARAGAAHMPLSPLPWLCQQVKRAVSALRWGIQGSKDFTEPAH